MAQREADGWTSDWLSRWQRDPQEVDGAEVGMLMVGTVFSTWAGIDPRDQNHPFLSATGSDLYRAFGASGPTELLTAAPGQPPGPNGISTDGAIQTQNDFASTPDLGMTVFSTSDPLLSADNDTNWDVYLSHGGDLQLLSHNIDGTPNNTGTNARLGAPDVQARGMGRSGFPVSQGISPISEDGTAVVFNTAAALDPVRDQDASSDVYLWKNGHVSLLGDSQRTTPQCPNDCAVDVTFAGMAADASVIYLSTTEQLTNTDHDTGRDIYAYALGETPALRLVTDGDDNNVAHPVSVSRDGSRLFFLSAGRLGNDPPAGSTPVIYRADAAGTEIETVGALAATDPSNPGSSGANVVQNLAAQRPVRATANGDALAFVTSAPLDPARDHDTAPDVYLWREGNSPRLVSDGGTQNVTAHLGASTPFDASMAPGGGRGITSDASSVFFSTTEALTPGAGDNGRTKVYAWRQATGVQLVSPPGVDAAAATYADNSASGDSVFFRTVQSLVGADQDGGESDVYAARVGGGFPEPVVASCDGDDCQAPPALPPADPPLGSPGFVGLGNVPPPVPAEPAGRIKVNAPRRAVKGVRANIRVTVPEAGALRTSGSGLKGSSRTAKRATTYRVSVRLSKRSVRRVRRGHRVTLRVTVRFVPKRGEAQQARVSMTFGQQQRRRGASRAVQHDEETVR